MALRHKTNKQTRTLHEFNEQLGFRHYHYTLYCLFFIFLSATLFNMYRQSLYCGFKVREWLRKTKGGAVSKNNWAEEKKTETHQTKWVMNTLSVPFVPGSETLPAHVRLLTDAWNLLVIWLQIRYSLNTIHSVTEARFDVSLVTIYQILLWAEYVSSYRLFSPLRLVFQSFPFTVTSNIQSFPFTFSPNCQNITCLLTICILIRKDQHLIAGAKVQWGCRLRKCANCYCNIIFVLCVINSTYCNSGPSWVERVRLVRPTSCPHDCCYASCNAFHAPFL
jgi:hypothetical protein